MDESSIEMYTSLEIELTKSLDNDPASWKDHLKAVRATIASLTLVQLGGDPLVKQWQIPLLEVFQRVAFADADHGGIQDIADWCLRQALTLLQGYPNDVELLALIGQNWLLRAQKPLAKIHHDDPDTSSSGASGRPISRGKEQHQASRAELAAAERLSDSDHVEARGILLPATDYFKRAVDSAQSQDKLTGELLAQAAEAYMSLGNVSPPRVNSEYFHETLRYLRTARDLPQYSLPAHLQQYLEEYGPLDVTTD